MTLTFSLVTYARQLKHNSRVRIALLNCSSQSITFSLELRPLFPKAVTKCKANVNIYVNFGDPRLILLLSY